MFTILRKTVNVYDINLAVHHGRHETNIFCIPILNVYGREIILTCYNQQCCGNSQ